LLSIVVPWIWSLVQGNSRAIQINYTKFTKDVKADQVSQVTITGDKIQGELNKSATKTVQGGLFSGCQSIKYTSFITYVPTFGDNQLLGTLRQDNIEIVTQPQQSFLWGVILLNAIPFLLLLGVGYYFLTRMRSQGQNIFSNVPFFNITGLDFMEMFVGVGASSVRNLFQEAKKAAPSIISIDELDSNERRRGAGLGGGHDGVTDGQTTRAEYPHQRCRE